MLPPETGIFTSPAVSPAVSVVIMLWAWTGRAASAKPPARVPATTKPRRLSSVRAIRLRMSWAKSLGVKSSGMS